METETVSITILSVSPIQAKHLYALIDAELLIAGIAIGVRGISARHLPGGGTSVVLPQYRDSTGVWRASVTLPVEIRDALCDQVLAHLLESGIARSRYQTAVA